MPPFQSSPSWDSKPPMSTTLVEWSMYGQIFFVIPKASFSLSNTNEAKKKLYPVCRNILDLTNHFELAEQNITLENYDQWFDHLNSTYPDQVASLKLRPCDLQKFLDQVLTF